MRNGTANPRNGAGNPTVARSAPSPAQRLASLARFGYGLNATGQYVHDINRNLLSFSELSDDKIESPEEVVSDALQAVIDSVEDVYPGEQAKQMAAQLLSDPKALEKTVATMLPSSTQ